MPKIGITNVSSAGGAITSSTISKGKIGGEFIIGVGSPVQPHGSGPHANAVMVEGTSKFTIEGIQVCREGDAASCGHTLTGGAGQSTSG